MPSPYLSIILLNYNRPVLGQWVLYFLEKQIEKNFEVILADNGSDDSIDQKYIESLSYPILILKVSKKIDNSSKLLNAVLPLASGEIIMPFVADDDFFIPSFTSVVGHIFKNNPTIHHLSVSTINYDFKNKSLYRYALSDANSTYTNKLSEYSAREVIFAYMSQWYLGKEKHNPIPQCGHPSSTIVRRDLLNYTVSKQGSLFCDIFGDVGLLGLLLNTKYLYTFDLPLVVLGVNHKQDSSIMKLFYGESKMQDTRMRWNQYKSNIRHSPLKGITHFNLGLESHLQVLKNNNFDIDVLNDLRIDFFVNHLNAILTDNPWTEQSEIDFEEGISVLKEKMLSMNVNNIQQVISMYLDKKEAHKKSIEMTPPQQEDSFTYDLSDIHEKIDNLEKTVNEYLPKTEFNSFGPVIDFKLKE